MSTLIRTAEVPAADRLDFVREMAADTWVPMDLRYERADVLARLWDAVAPGGHLLVQDYDIRGVNTAPELDWIHDVTRVITGAFEAAGADVTTGARLPQLFAQAGVGTPDGTDVAGRIEPLATGRTLIEGVLHSLLPTALAHGVTHRGRLRRDALPDRPGRHPVPRPVARVAADDRRLEAQGAHMTPDTLLVRVQLCIHRRRSTAGLWVSHRNDMVVRRPWCLACCRIWTGSATT